MNNKNLKYGAVSTSVMVVAIVVVVVLNLVTNVLSDKVPFSIDLTKNQLFSLTDESKDFARNLNQDVEIVVLSDEKQIDDSGEYYKQAVSVIKEYAKASDKIKLTFKNVVKDPAYLNQYSSENISQGSIIVKTENKHKVIATSDLFNMEQGYYRQRILSSKAEQTIMSAILNVTGSENQTKVAFLQGYGELQDTGFEVLLEKNNYVIEYVDVLTDQIPSDAHFVVVLAPSTDYDSVGVDKLNKFLENDGNYGKSLFVVGNAQVSEYTNLNSVLEKWGLKLEGSLAFDMDRTKLTYPELGAFGYVASYADDTYTKNIKNSSAPFFSAQALSVGITDESSAKALLKLSSKSGVKPLNDQSWEFSEDKCTGDVIVAAASEKKVNESAGSTNVFVFGSHISVAQQVLNMTSYSNSTYLMNIVNSISGQNDVSITIEPKSFENNELPVSSSQVITWSILLCVVLPIIVIVIGIVVICLRKYRL